MTALGPFLDTLVRTCLLDGSKQKNVPTLGRDVMRFAPGSLCIYLEATALKEQSISEYCNHWDALTVLT
jgi:hypothetical protein